MSPNGGQAVWASKHDSSSRPGLAHTRACHKPWYQTRGRAVLALRQHKQLDPSRMGKPQIPFEHFWMVLGEAVLSGLHLSRYRSSRLAAQLPGVCLSHQLAAHPDRRTMALSEASRILAPRPMRRDDNSQSDRRVTRTRILSGPLMRIYMVAALLPQ